VTWLPRTRLEEPETTTPWQLSTTRWSRIVTDAESLKDGHVVEAGHDVVLHGFARGVMHADARPFEGRTGVGTFDLVVIDDHIAGQACVSIVDGEPDAVAASGVVGDGAAVGGHDEPETQTTVSGPSSGLAAWKPPQYPEQSIGTLVTSNCRLVTRSRLPVAQVMTLLRHGVKAALTAGQDSTVPGPDPHTVTSSAV
jgi:hypothetical protein